MLSDCPDFLSLAPPTKTKLLSSLKRGGRGKQEEEEEGEEGEGGRSDLRMCSSCHRLIHRSADTPLSLIHSYLLYYTTMYSRLMHVLYRRLGQLQNLQKPLVSALYEVYRFVCVYVSCQLCVCV